MRIRTRKLIAIFPAIPYTVYSATSSKLSCGTKGVSLYELRNHTPKQGKRIFPSDPR